MPMPLRDERGRFITLSPDMIPERERQRYWAAVQASVMRPGTTVEFRGLRYSISSSNYLEMVGRAPTRSDASNQRDDPVPVSLASLQDYAEMVEAGDIEWGDSATDLGLGIRLFFHMSDAHTLKVPGYGVWTVNVPARTSAEPGPCPIPANDLMGYAYLGNWGIMRRTSDARALYYKVLRIDGTTTVEVVVLGIGTWTIETPPRPTLIGDCPIPLEDTHTYERERLAGTRAWHTERVSVAANLLFQMPGPGAVLANRHAYALPPLPNEDGSQPDTPELPRCSRCDTPCFEEYGEHTEGFGFLCQGCIDRHYSTCRTCETLFDREHSDSEQYCQDCYNDTYYCSACGGRFTEERMHMPGGNAGGRSMVCNTCHARGYVVCAGCDLAIPAADAIVRRGQTYCRGCGRPPSAILEYNYRIQYEMPPIGTGPHWYGVELEVESTAGSGGGVEKEKAASFITKILSNFAKTKRDGSLHSGFEIVTRPASLAEQIKNWDRLFNAGVPKGLRSFQTDTCGLHVHTSRLPLSDLTIGRMLVFVNDPHHRGFIEKIAGRGHSGYAQKHEKKLRDGSIRRQSAEHYDALNTEHTDTIELRVFRGTLKRESLYKAIEFVAALVRFCTPGSSPPVAAWKDPPSGQLVHLMCEFIKKNREEWPHLWGFVSAKWLNIDTKEGRRCGYWVDREE